MNSKKQISGQIKYDPAVIEPKWQKVWQDQKVFSPDLDKPSKPYYNLMMFPYPSAEGMHAGNMYAFTGADIWGRYQRMKGNAVFEPMGLDGFGIHSENYAIKIGEHPVEVSKRTEKRFYTQLQATGNAFDWTKTLETYDPDYYRWTQWIFIQMFKHGLAYRQKAKVNWCPSCLTVLADEQVISGECERCSSKVEDRDLEQWFFKITDYADRLLNNLEKINWTEKIKIAQRNWIGRSEGAEIEFRIKGQELRIKVFTTRPDTLYGTTFMALAPDSEWVEKLTTDEQKEEVVKYLALKGVPFQSQQAQEENKVKDGVFTGSYVVNPATKKQIPVWVSNYVLSGYGFGAVMGVPAHDQRDFEFAKKYKIEMVPTIKAEVDFDPQSFTEAYTGEGTIINSNDWDGLSWSRDREKILSSIEEQGWGRRMITYHLRDWLISRQRYWGPPIPMIYCEKCAIEKKGEREDMLGWYTVPEEQLPVKLPYIENYRPAGTSKSPLAQDSSFVGVNCPDCGAQASRETDVSDTFLDSAWYFLRYPSLGSKNSTSKPFDPEITKKWLPVHMYIGGAEHAVLHLMYSRFVTMALHDWGYLDFEEPFTRFYAHGLLIKEGAKMSKSKGNVIVPDAYIKKYGADTLRMYLMFLSPFEQGGDFRDTGMEGMFKFVRRVWELVVSTQDLVLESEEDSRTLISAIHKTIKRVTEDLENLHYNRAIAGIMEYVNTLKEERGVAKKGIKCAEWEQARETLLKLFAPFAPHMTEELWRQLGHSDSIHFSPWPSFDEALVQDEFMTIPVQINGKLRGTVSVSSDDAQDQGTVEARAREVESIRLRLAEKEVKKVIFVPGKAINFVV